ncbi:SDR family NAD(P)-dependent oxidoreductase [Bradyrhizobium sp. NC92]|uniref:SDR family NAD(P)-dependent oxidoreductase n=1 Tax=Bradyrhizobium sp. (strain NC92) TaxID=55395 RepID=UPI0039061BE2
MMNCDSRRRALVTASSKDLGFAIARRLAQDGAYVVICGRDQSALERAAAHLRTIPQCAHRIVADLGRRSEVDALFERAVRLMWTVDCLLNSGHMPYGTIEALTDEDWHASHEMRLCAQCSFHEPRPDLLKHQIVQGISYSLPGVHETAGHLLLSNVMRAGTAVVVEHPARRAFGALEFCRARLF